MENYEEIIVPEGADQDFEIYAFKADGSPDDLTAYADIVIVVHNGKKVEIAKYSVAGLSGFGVMTIDSVNTNCAKFRLTHAHTLAAAGNKLFYELRTKEIITVSPVVFYRKMLVNQYLCTVPTSLIVPIPS